MSLIEELTTISDVIDNNNYSHMIMLYRMTVSKERLKDKISNDLYISYVTELECVYNESIFGDGSYDELVANDYNKTVKEIIEYLKNQ